MWNQGGDAVNPRLLHNAGFVRLALEEHRDILPMPLWKNRAELELDTAIRGKARFFFICKNDEVV